MSKAELSPDVAKEIRAYLEIIDRHGDKLTDLDDIAHDVWLMLPDLEPGVYAYEEWVPELSEREYDREMLKFVRGLVKRKDWSVAEKMSELTDLVKDGLCL